VVEQRRAVGWRRQSSPMPSIGWQIAREVFGMAMAQDASGGAAAPLRFFRQGEGLPQAARWMLTVARCAGPMSTRRGPDVALDGNKNAVASGSTVVGRVPSIAALDPVHSSEW